MKKFFSILFLMFFSITMAICGGVVLAKQNRQPLLDFSEIEASVNASSTTPSIDGVLTTNFNGVDISFNKKRNIVTLNGAYANNGDVGYILQTETLSNLSSGKVVGLKVEYVGGNVSGGGRVVFMWDLFNMAGDIIQRSTTEPTIEKGATYFANELNVSAASAYFKLALWRNIDLGGSPTFSNAQFRLTLIYDAEWWQEYDCVTFDYNYSGINPNLFDASKIVDYELLTYSDEKFSAQTIAGNYYSYFKMLHYRNSVLTDEKFVFSQETQTGILTINKQGINSTLKLGFNGNNVDALFLLDISNLPDGVYTISAVVESLSDLTGTFKEVKIESGDTKTAYSAPVKSVLCNSIYGILPMPTRENYTFSGWKLNLASAGEYFYTDAVAWDDGRYLIEYSNTYWSNINLIKFVNDSSSTIRVSSNYVISSIYCYDREGNFINDAGVETKEHNIPAGTHFIRFENLTAYLSFAKRDALKVIYDSNTIESTTTANLFHDHTLVASWTPNEVSNTVHLRVVNADGSYIDEGNNAGGTVEVEGYQILGSESTFKRLEDAHSGKTYSVHQGQQFRLTANANDGYAFVGFSTSAIPSEVIKNPTTKPNGTVSYYPTSNADYYVYFKKISENQLKYDETDKYFYFEDGYYPQSEAGKLNYVSGISDSFDDLKVKSYVETNIVELNGAYPDNSNVHIFFNTEKVNNLKIGQKVTLKVEHLSGSISGGGRVIFMWRLYNNEGNSVQGSSHEPSIENISTELTNNLDVNLSEGYFGVSLWRNTDVVGTPKFVNARFRVTIVYDNFSDFATPTHETITYNNGKNDVELPIYNYGNERLAKVAKNGVVKWFKFEPIRWRISDYGVEKDERNILRYSTLLKFKNYASFSDDFFAVSDLILGVGAMHNTRKVDENSKNENGNYYGTFAIDMIGHKHVEKLTDGLDLQASFNKTTTIIDAARYGITDLNEGNSVANTADRGVEMLYSAPIRVVSTKELQSIGFVNFGARATDMVAFILGQDKNQVSYWTRDLSNLGAGLAITPTGTQVRPWLVEMLGMRFAYTFKEGSNIDFYN